MQGLRMRGLRMRTVLRWWRLAMTRFSCSNSLRIVWRISGALAPLMMSTGWPSYQFHRHHINWNCRSKNINLRPGRARSVRCDRGISPIDLSYRPWPVGRKQEETHGSKWKHETRPHLPIIFIPERSGADRRPVAIWSLSDDRPWPCKVRTSLDKRR